MWWLCVRALCGGSVWWLLVSNMHRIKPTHLCKYKLDKPLPMLNTYQCLHRDRFLQPAANTNTKLRSTFLIE